MNKKIIVFTAFILAQSLSVSAYTPSKWASEEIASAKNIGITAFESFDKAYTSPVTRQEICSLIINTLEIGLNREIKPVGSSPFDDTDNDDVICAYEFGIVSGMGENLFMPQRQLSRQEASKIFTSACEVLQGKTLQYEKNTAKEFNDFSLIASWAKDYVSAALENGLFKGDENGNFNPLMGVTVEQSAVICYRMLNTATSDDTTNTEYVQSDLDVSAKVCDGTANVTWNYFGECRVQISQQRNSYYDDEFDANVTELSVSNGEIELAVNPNKTYTITVFTDNGKKDGVTFETDNFTIDYNHREEIKSEVNAFTSAEDSSVAMKTLTVPVWQLKDGKKQASELTLTVLASISDKVEAVFNEIFNGDERFPIYSLGAYSWRAPMSSGRYSEHNFGTAIDLNPNENYCLYTDGSTVGECYDPYNNPYSVTPYGDVVNAFEKYGFTWGADSWRSPKDYMHFSYLGT